MCFFFPDYDAGVGSRSTFEGWALPPSIGPCWPSCPGCCRTICIGWWNHCRWQQWNQARYVWGLQGSPPSRYDQIRFVHTNSFKRKVWLIYIQRIECQSNSLSLGRLIFKHCLKIMYYERFEIEKIHKKNWENETTSYRHWKIALLISNHRL